MKSPLRILLPILVAMTALLLLSACHQEEPVRNSPGLPSCTADTTIALPLPADEDPVLQTCAMHESVIYYTKYADPCVYRFEITGQESEVFWDSGSADPAYLAADAGFLAVLEPQANTITTLSYEGQVLRTYALPETDSHFTMIDTGDGIFVVASKTEAYRIDQESGKATALEMKKVSPAVVTDLAVVSRKRILVSAIYGGTGMTDVFEFNAKGKNTDAYVDAAGREIVYDDEEIWSLGGDFMLYRYSLADKTLVTVRSLLPDFPEFRGGYALSFAVEDGKAAVIWLDNQSLVVYPPQEGEDQLHILAPQSSYWQIFGHTVLAGESNVTVDTMADEEYAKRVNTKLLAQSGDFDLCYVSGTLEEVTELLAALIRNHVYVDLNTNSRLRTNLGETLPGLLDLIEDGGEIPILPLSLQGSFLLPAAGAPACQTVSELLDAVNDADGQQPCFSDEYPLLVGRILLSMMNGGILADSDVLHDGLPVDLENRIRETLNLWLPLIESGMLMGSNPLYSPLARPINLEKLSEHIEENLFLLPSYDADGGSTIGIDSFYFVNPYSPNKEKALAFLGAITDPANRYNTAIFESPLCPGCDEYYQCDGVIEKEPKKPDISENQYKLLDEWMNICYDSSTMDWMHITRKAMEAMQKFCAGSLSVEEVTQILVEEYAYVIEG